MSPKVLIGVTVALPWLSNARSNPAQNRFDSGFEVGTENTCVGRPGTIRVTVACDWVIGCRFSPE